MVSDLGVEPRSAEGLLVGRPLTTFERDSLPYRSVSILLTSLLTTLELPTQKQSARAPKW